MEGRTGWRNFVSLRCCRPWKHCLRWRARTFAAGWRAGDIGATSAVYRCGCTMYHVPLNHGSPAARTAPPFQSARDLPNGRLFAPRPRDSRTSELCTKVTGTPMLGRPRRRHCSSDLMAAPSLPARTTTCSHSSARTQLLALNSKSKHTT